MQWQGDVATRGEGSPTFTCGRGNGNGWAATDGQRQMGMARSKRGWGGYSGQGQRAGRQHQWMCQGEKMVPKRAGLGGRVPTNALSPLSSRRRVLAPCPVSCSCHCRGTQRMSARREPSALELSLSWQDTDGDHRGAKRVGHVCAQLFSGPMTLQSALGQLLAVGKRGMAYAAHVRYLVAQHS